MDRLEEWIKEHERMYVERYNKNLLKPRMLEREVGVVRAGSSRSNWKFKRGRGRLKYRIVNQVLKD